MPNLPFLMLNNLLPLSKSEDDEKTRQLWLFLLNIQETKKCCKPNQTLFRKLNFSRGCEACIALESSYFLIVSLKIQSKNSLLILTAVTAFRQEKIGFPKFKENKLFWINHTRVPALTVTSKYSATKQNSFPSYSNIKHYPIWVDLLILYPGLILL